MGGKLQTVAIDKIRTDGGTQVRVGGIDGLALARYVAAKELPPPTVFDDGQDLWLADGFHRLKAHHEKGRKRIEVEVIKGTVREAILHAVGANDSHGLPRSNEDKRAAVLKLLNDEEWSKKSDRWIAEQCKVSNPMVSSYRKQLLNFNTSPRRGKDGKEYKPPQPKSPPSESVDEDEDLPESEPRPTERPPAAPRARKWNGDAVVDRVRDTIQAAIDDWQGPSLRPLIDELELLTEHARGLEKQRGKRTA